MPATAEKIKVNERTGYIGGSDAPAILGLSPWSSPLQVYADKVGSGIKQPYDEARERLFFFGNMLEETIGRAVERFHGMPVERNTQFWRAKDRPFMGGHIDFLMSEEQAFLECKNVRFAGENWGKMPSRPDDDGSGLIPPYYVPQVDHYLHILDFDYCYVAVLLGGNELRVYRIYRDAGREKVLLKAEDELWQRVQDEDPPMGTDYDSFCLALRLGYVETMNAKQAKKADHILLSDAQAELAKELAKKNRAVGRARREATELRKQFIETLGGKLGYFCDNYGEELGSLLSARRTNFDKDLMRTEHPDIYKEFLLTHLYPKLKLNGVEDDDEEQ